MRLHPVFLTLLLSVTGLVSALADWPTYRSDPARSGYTQESIPNQLVLRWVHRSTHAPRPAWPTSDRIDFDLVFQPIIMGDWFCSAVRSMTRSMHSMRRRVRRRGRFSPARRFGLRRAAGKTGCSWRAMTAGCMRSH